MNAVELILSHSFKKQLEKYKKLMHQKIYFKFTNSNVFFQLFLFLFTSLLIAESIGILFEIINSKDVFILDFSNYSVQKIIFEVVFLAPLLETFFIQFLLIELFILISSKMGIKKKHALSVIFSSVIFGVLHQYNTPYMIATTVLGLIFGSIYIFYKINGKVKPFIAVLLVHSFHNFITLVKDYSL